MSLWITIGAIILIALIALSSLNIPITLLLVPVLLASVGLLTRKKTTEIDLANLKIRMIWRVGFFVWSRAYSLDDYETVKIRLSHRLIEGYQSPVFFIAFVGSRRHITIYSTDDPEEAKTVRGVIAGFLENRHVETSS